jgi:hypothetical protein
MLPKQNVAIIKWYWFCTIFHKKIYDSQVVTKANLDMFVVWGKIILDHFS